LTVGKKLVGGYLVVAAMTAALGGFSTYQLAKVNAVTQELSATWMASLSTLGLANGDLSDIQRLQNKHILDPNPEWMEMDEKALAEAIKSFKEQMKKSEPTMVTDKEKELFRGLMGSLDTYLAAVDKVVAMSRQGKKKEAWIFARANTVVEFNKINDYLNQLVVYNIKGGADLAVTAETSYNVARNVNFGAILLVVLAAMALGLLITRQITRGVNAVGLAAEGIAQGELDQRLDVDSDDELGDMAQSMRAMTTYLKAIATAADGLSQGDLTVAVTPKSERDQLGTAVARMVTSLREVVGHVRAAATAVASAADSTGAAVHQTSSSMEEMAASIQQVAGNAETLAGNVEETSSSIEEMAASIQQVAGNGESLSSAVNQTSASIGQMAVTIEQVAGNVLEANQIAQKAADAAAGGSQAVEQTVAGMGHITRVMGELGTVIQGLGKSSAEIGNIVELIDDIAEQTNLLALNAAIEAARAGEHGRGFAVVADEVRKLAERSAKATKEIADLIKGIQRETQQAIESTRQGDEAIQAGTRLSTEAGRSLEQIVASVTTVTRLMSQITDATQEQSTASGQITQAADHMSKLTGQVSGATREQARSSEQIIRAVDHMNQLTRQVTGAAQEQKRSGDQIVGALEDINRQSLDLQRQAQSLLDAIAFFKDGQAAPPAREISINVAAAPRALATNGKR
jgi:methyl-accepting chemotaxis protein